MTFAYADCSEYYLSVALRLRLKVTRGKTLLKWSLRPRVMSFWLFCPGKVQSTMISRSRCWSVLSHNLKTTRPNFTNFVHVAYDLDSILL